MTLDKIDCQRVATLTNTAVKVLRSTAPVNIDDDE